MAAAIMMQRAAPRRTATCRQRALAGAQDGDDRRLDQLMQVPSAMTRVELAFRGLAALCLALGCNGTSLTSMSPLVGDGGGELPGPDGPAGIPDSLAHVPDGPPGVPDGPPAAGVPDAPLPGVPDGPPAPGMPDARLPGVPDAPPPGVPDAPPPGVPDAPPPGVPDAPPPPVRTPATWGAAAGLTETIYDVGTDASGNVWAIGLDTLYLLTPGASSFVGFTNADGLHVVPFTAPDGSAQITRLTAVAGGGANEVFLGYFGYESSDPFADTEEQKELGNGDRIEYDAASGTISVHRYFFRCTYDISKCWEDRSVRRVIYARAGAAAGHSFWGFNHGATHVFNDVIGDHVHPEVNWVMGDMVVTHYGEQQGLFINDDGTLWVASRYGVGRMNWDPDPIAWVTAHFQVAFTTFTDDHGLDVPWGYVEDNRAASVTPDGTLWLASADFGVSSWNPATPLASMTHWGPAGGLPTSGLVDLVADVDGTLWIVTGDRALVHFDPASATLTSTAITDARRLFIDRSVTPRALYVARSSGVTLLP
jgi:hypothetical protein